jgi:hypothetical protein
VDTFKKDLASVRALVQQLRVPELSYQQDLRSRLDSSAHDSLDHEVLNALSVSINERGGTLVKHLVGSVGAAFTPQQNNISFLVDRIFDVWMRKNHLASDVNELLSGWRFTCARIMLNELAEDQLKSKGASTRAEFVLFIELIESIAKYSLAWSAIPERSKHFLLDELQNLDRQLVEAEELDLAAMQSIFDVWHDFGQKQDSKFIKITQRLIDSETKKSWSHYSYWFAQNYVDALFNKRRIPESLQNFLDFYWINAVSRGLISDDSGRVYLKESLAELTKSLILSFCTQGEQAFSLADHILEDLQNTLQGLNIEAEDDIWLVLEESLVSALKKDDSVEKQYYKPIALDSDIERQFGRFNLSEHLPKADTQANSSVETNSLYEVGNLYLVPDQLGSSNIMKLVHVFEFSKQLLFANYLGMKAAQFSNDEFELKLKLSEIRLVAEPNSFSKVYSAAVKGLLKVADSQQQARIAAAEKAKAEAEKLLAAKLLADQAAAKHAEEIAERTQLMLIKRAEKQKLEKENAVIEKIKSFSIGAWISVAEDGASNRYKLVVKLAATGKYIFVDKLGIKKKEYKEAALVEAMMAKNIEILSDGAEFEDSLERVVSRLRMSK